MGIGFATVGTFVLACVATLLSREVAIRVGHVAPPRSDRWHARPTALAGGVGIFVAVLPALLLSGLPRVIALGATAMFVLGLVDDILRLNPYSKLVAQFTVASITVVSGVSIPSTPWAVANQGVTIFWIVAVTNALNLLDNMDGLAAGITVVAASFQAAYFGLEGHDAELVTCLALAAACGGFLLFNWHPATIFMGDCGALVLGYLLASMASLHPLHRTKGLAAVVAPPLLVMLVPIFDTVFVTLTRLLRGQPVTMGGRDHTSHRLVVLGLSEKAAVRLLVSVGALGGLVGLLAIRGHLLGVWIAAPLLVVALAFLGVHLARSDVGASARASLPQVRLLAWLAHFTYKRRIFEVVLDATLACVALLAAIALRYDGVAPTAPGLARMFPALIGAKLLALQAAGIYAGLWRYVGVRDLVRIGAATLGVGGLTIVACATYFGFEALPPGAIVMDSILFGGLVAGSRGSFRLLRYALGDPEVSGQERRRRVLVWGADDDGVLLVRRLLLESDDGPVPVGFIDDELGMLGRRFEDLAVLGASGDIPRLLQRGMADAVVVASSRVPSSLAREIAALAGPGRVHRVRLVYEEISHGVASA